MRAAGTVAVLLPGAFYFTRDTTLPPIDALRAAGVPLALATDSNPGTSPLTSPLLAMNMAATLFRMTVDECIAGFTREAARALGRADRVGRWGPYRAVSGPAGGRGRLRRGAVGAGGRAEAARPGGRLRGLAMKSLVVPTAERFVGWVKETSGANDGPWVEAIQRTTGNKRGDPWCASWVNFVLQIAYSGRSPLPVTASCDVILEWARKQGRIVETPEPGDVFLVMRTPTDAVHTGFVSRDTAHTVGTYEGNTNSGGSRDGWGVFARERRKTNLLFVRV